MRAAAAVLLSLLLAIPVLGAVRDEPQPAPSFVPVQDSQVLASQSSHLDPSLPNSSEWSSTRPDTSSGLSPSRLNPAVPSPRLVVVARSGADGGVDGGMAIRASGTASWYCGHGSPCTRGYPGGLYAAAGPALRVGNWRGRTVLVRAGSRSVAVTLIDWCFCGSGRVLDLFSDAFRRLAPLSQGVVSVTVSW